MLYAFQFIKQTKYYTFSFIIKFLFFFIHLKIFSSQRITKPSLQRRKTK